MIDRAHSCWKQWQAHHAATRAIVGPYDILEIGWRTKHAADCAERRFWKAAEQVVWC
jgi:hypothetical protein